MKNKLTSIGIVGLFVIAGFLGFVNLCNDTAEGTYVSGIVFDGSGGPWTVAGSPYIVVGDVTVPDGMVLSIEPDVIVKFDDYYSMIVEGTLIAIGTPIHEITITSNMAMPAPGDWGCIQIGSIGHGEISFCDISYGSIGIYVAGSSGNVITNNEVSYHNYYGIYVDNSTGNTISGNSMVEDGIGIFGIQLEHWNSHTIDNTNSVNGKPVYYWKNQNAGTIPSGAGQVILANCTNIVVEYQELTHGSLGIELGFSSNNDLIGNNASNHNLHSMGEPSGGNASVGIDFARFYGIYMYYSDSNEVTGNTMLGNEWGICLDNSNGNKIDHNVVHDNFFGIVSHFSSDTTVSDNTVSTDNDLDSQAGYGIHMFSATNSVIARNDISKSGKGIYIQNSQGITVSQNTISSDKAEGIRCWVSDNVVIIYNNIIDNDIGIRLFTSNFNFLVHHNNFWDNRDQAIDGESNVWDNGYPSGGNFWSDYTGPDTNGDGIGDIPYVIDGDSQDNYPLMEPVQSSNMLYQGWNLVSIPFIQQETDLDTVLGSISGLYSTVQCFNANDVSDHWKHFHTAKPPYMNDLDSIDHTMGFWIQVTEPGGILFEYPGMAPTRNQAITLYQGWNLVGYPSLSGKSRENALNNIIFGTDIESIRTFNAEDQTWIELGESDFFEGGKGYWIFSHVEKTWEVPL